MSFTITSSSFGNGTVIPKQYTGEGEDISPELSWSGAPDGTKSFVLICDDPDAPNGTWTHWVAFDIPADLAMLRSGAKKGTSLGHGIKQGKQDFGNTGYQGPMPPRGHGRHRYYFTLYALDRASLDLSEGTERSKVERAMQGRILGKTQWMGTYERK